MAQLPCISSVSTIQSSQSCLGDPKEYWSFRRHKSSHLFLTNNPFAESFEDQEPESSYIVAIIVIAMASASGRNQNLDIQHVPLNIFLAQQSASLYQTLIKRHIAQAFQHLQRLKVVLELDESRDQADSSPATYAAAHFTDFIQSATNLTSLQLFIPTTGLPSMHGHLLQDSGDYWVHLPWDTTNIMKELTLPHLNKLKLDGLRSSQDAVVSFMQRHKETLRNFKVQTGWLELSRSDKYPTGAASWRYIFELLAPQMNLDTVYFKFMWDRDMDESLLEAVIEQRAEDLSTKITWMDSDSYASEASSYLLSRGKTVYPTVNADQFVVEMSDLTE